MDVASRAHGPLGGYEWNRPDGFVRLNGMRPLRWLVPVLAVLSFSVACTSKPESTEGDAAGTGSPPASRQIAMPVGHCWIDPVRFDGLKWAVAPQDQFGWGGRTPKNWDGQGVIVRLSETRSRYTDRGGHVLRLVPAVDPSAAAVFKRGCD